MRNCAVKFALMTARLTGERPDLQEYMDLSPIEALAHYKAYLSKEECGVLLFGFSEPALLAVLDGEFEVGVERQVLVFRKTFLDAQSIRLAGGRYGNRHARLFSATEEAVIQSLADWLLDATRQLYRSDLDEQHLLDIKQEYAENFRVYAEKCVPEKEPGSAELLLRSLFGSLKAMRAFTHTLTVDAMFKADAAKVLFGESSGYAQAWLRKQIFRHMMSQEVEQAIQRCVL